MTTAPDNKNGLIQPLPGWKRVEGIGGPANIFELDETRPEFPEKWRARSEARDLKRLEQDSRVQEEIARLRAEFGKIDWRRAAAFIERGAEIREAGGDDEIFRNSALLIEAFRVKIREAVDRSRPKEVDHRVALRYFSEQLLPVEITFYVNDTLPERPSPVEILVNADPDKKLLMGVLPGDIVIRARGIVRRDIDRLGRFITEAIRQQSPDDAPEGPGGRRTIDERPDDAATAELIARLFHWEGWSQRRIAAFLGWMKPTDDWSDPKTRARIEQRVRRWLRAGESELRKAAGDDSWRARPAQIEAAALAEQDGRGRRER